MSEYHFPGIICNSPEALRSHVMISSVKILKNARAHGFQNDRAILPTEPRSLTDRELNDLVAVEGTKDPLMLIRVPKEVGNRALAAWTGNDIFEGPSVAITDGIQGSFIGIREDPPNRPSTTMVPLTIGGDPEDGLSMLGVHIDYWKDKLQKLAVANLGPGLRWHKVAPGYNIDIIGSHYDAKLADYVQANPEASACYWLRLDPPDPQGHITLLVNSPVARVAHDGFVEGAEPSLFSGIRLDSCDVPLLRAASIV